jgi:hypothetical protein
VYDIPGGSLQDVLESLFPDRSAWCDGHAVRRFPTLVSRAIAALLALQTTGIDMSAKSYDLHGVRVFECPAEGPPLRDDRDAIAVIGEAWRSKPDWLSFPPCG